MNTLKYKGFIGSVNFSEADGVFFGKIEGIDGLVNFQGASIQEITRSFHKAVDDYVAFCKKQGIPPRKSYTGNLNIRISPATHNSIADYAAEAGITINAFIRRALEKAVENPADIMEPLVSGYAPAGDSAMALGEPAVRYGSRDITQFWIPSEDIPLAKAMARKMGWEFMLNYPESGLEVALDELHSGKVSEFANFKDLMKSIEEEEKHGDV